MKPELIYCGGGNIVRATIAKKHGFKLGAQLPNSKVYEVYQPLHFADQDFKRPRYADYIKAIRHYRPYMASVLDIEEWRRYDEYLMRMEEISQYCQQIVMLIPKINGVIRQLESDFPDKKINNRQIVLGYSVPTPFGKTEVPKSEFIDWPVHLLGGSPLTQLAEYKNFNTVSIDGNSHNGHANFGRFFTYEPFIDAVNKHWPTLREFYGERQEGNGPLLAFELSCKNIMAMWQNESI